MVASPEIPAGPEVRIASNSVDLMCEARVILNAQSEPETLILSNKQLGVEMKLPARAWPFITGRHPVIISLCLFQSWIEGAGPGLQLIKGKA